MYKFIKRMISGNPVYVKISPDLLSVTDISTGKQFADKPVVAIKSGKLDRILALGHSAEITAATDPDVRIVNGFSHPRSILNNFQAAEKVLIYFLKQVLQNSLFQPSPVIILHPLDKLEGGLTQIEIRALKELGAGAGAREVYIWTGRKLTNMEMQNGVFPDDGWVDGAPGNLG